jgi:hypothetical protein
MQGVHILESQGKVREAKSGQGRSGKLVKNVKMSGKSAIKSGKFARRLAALSVGAFVSTMFLFALRDGENFCHRPRECRFIFYRLSSGDTATYHYIYALRCFLRRVRVWVCCPFCVSVVHGMTHESARSET